MQDLEITSLYQCTCSEVKWLHVSFCAYILLLSLLLSAWLTIHILGAHQSSAGAWLEPYTIIKSTIQQYNMLLASWDCTYSYHRNACSKFRILFAKKSCLLRCVYMTRNLQWWRRLCNSRSQHYLRWLSAFDFPLMSLYWRLIHPIPAHHGRRR